jgi:1-acyl-sn-glycerol-3-phosphate acyltransferase
MRHPGSRTQALLRRQLRLGVGLGGPRTPAPEQAARLAAQDALDTAQRLLSEDKLLGMYPEGTRSPDGRLYKGKSGMARLALETGVPVIPVAMIGTDGVNPPGSRSWRFGRVTVRFGEPMDFSRFEGLAGPARRAAAAAAGLSTGTLLPRSMNSKLSVLLTIATEKPRE